MSIKKYMLFLVFFIELIFLIFPALALSETLYPTEDSYVALKYPDSNYASSTSLIVDGNSEETISYLKFTIPDLQGITSLTLKIYATDSGYLSRVDEVTGTWSEQEIDYNNRPSVLNNLLDSQVYISKDAWNSIVLSPYSLSEGTYAIAIKSSYDDGFRFSSTEATSNRPELVIEYTGEENIAEMIFLERIDVIENKQIDIEDIIAFLMMFKKSSSEERYDLNGDGKVDLSDIVQVAKNLGKKVEDEAPSPIEAVAIPLISPVSGTYTDSVSITMTTSTEGAVIRYTLDGSTPSSSSPLYQGGFSITSSKTVKARAFKTGMQESQTASSSFIIKQSEEEPTVLEISGDSFFVAVDGSDEGDGSIENPWNMNALLGGSDNRDVRLPSIVKPGDTVFFRGGKYGAGGNDYSEFKFYVSGDENKYITITSYPGEVATFDGGITINGGWLIFKDIEFTNTDTTRYTSVAGSHPTGYSRAGGISVLAPNVKLINNFIHDNGNGITGNWENDHNLEIYGNLVQNNGWKGPDREHGHGIYIQNEGTYRKYVENNIVFPGIDDTGMHLYGSDGLINNIHLRDNIHYTKRWLMQTESLSTDILMEDNYLWDSYIMFGFISSDGDGIIIKDNYVASYESPIEPYQLLYMKRNLNEFKITGNVFCYYDTGDVLIMDEIGYESDSNHVFNNNAVCRTNKANYDGSTISYDSWKSVSGFQQQEMPLERSSYTGMPAQNKIFISPNIYEEGRANIAVYNWQMLDAVSVDISLLGYEIGESYKIYNAGNYFGDAPIEGTYSGQPISIDMRQTRWTVAEPIGAPEYTPRNPYPHFGAFIIRKA